MACKKSKSSGLEFLRNKYKEVLVRMLICKDNCFGYRKQDKNTQKNTKFKDKIQKNMNRKKYQINLIININDETKQNLKLWAKK